MRFDGNPVILCCCSLFLLALMRLLLAELLGFMRATTDMYLPLRRKGFAGAVGAAQRRYRRLLYSELYTAIPPARIVASPALQALPPPPPLFDSSGGPRLQLDPWGDVTPKGFEKLVGIYFERRGFIVRHTGKTNDGGVDLKIYKNGKCGVVQCKYYDPQNTVGSQVIRDLRGTMIRERAVVGYVVTTSSFTRAAIAEALSVKSPPIKLVDRAHLTRFRDGVS